ncbi:MAG TPA: 3-methyl-2-oxobutanoate hydroxymethyltransferase [Candidatus Hydrogenedentes bacterium]|nr:3-methyl-2-oxobutanoate hydroxymethyltransferase [Candidatus Hydrogenedentota bacterium]
MACRVSTVTFRERKQAGEKIAVLTAYDYPTAKILDESGIDAILVGDSLGNVILGYENTLPVTMDDMAHHTRIVSRAVKKAMVIGDLPFLSYQINPEEALRNAGRLVGECGAQAVKLEGSAKKFGPAIEGILRAGVPVMGHIGLTPQSVHQFGGYKVQGRDEAARKRLKEEALGLQDIGCFAVVLECIPADVATEISASLEIPTIGIGAGAGCDGQVLVFHDMLGWGRTRFTKTYADVRGMIAEACKNYCEEVKQGVFPAKEHTYEA